MTPIFAIEFKESLDYYDPNNNIVGKGFCTYAQEN